MGGGVMREASALLLLAVLSAAGAARACEPIRVELCRNLGYNLTGMPNLVGHELQGDADFTLQTFSPLIQYGCSARLHFFLCSVYVPMCTEKVSAPIGPCRGLCESVRSRCFPVLQGFGFPWPAALNCSKFPTENNHEHMCMEGPREVSVGAIPASQISRMALDSRTISRGQASPCTGLARSRFYLYTNRSGRCVQLCDADLLFTAEEKRLAGTWLAFCTVLATACSLLGLLACLVEGGAPLAYPQRALVHLALCYAAAGLGWAVRLLLGRSSACQGDPADSETSLLLAQAATASPMKHSCVLIFLLLFYFNNAASIWWVMTALSWFLQSGLGWTSARIQQQSAFFHIAAWVFPAVQTVLIVFLRRIDADELTGTCYVGNQDSTSLIVFILVPQMAYLMLVGSMLILGFLTSIGHSRQGGWSVLHSLIYLVSNGCVVASYLYELWSREDWLLAVPPSPEPRLQPRANLWVFLLRMTMSVGLGVIVGLWVCFAKSQSWNGLFWSMDTKQKQPVPSIPQEIIQYYPQPQRVHKSRKHRKHNGETLV